MLGLATQAQVTARGESNAESRGRHAAVGCRWSAAKAAWLLAARRVQAGNRQHHWTQEVSGAGLVERAGDDKARVLKRALRNRVLRVIDVESHFFDVGGINVELVAGHPTEGDWSFEAQDPSLVTTVAGAWRIVAIGLLEDRAR